MNTQGYSLLSQLGIGVLTVVIAAIVLNRIGINADGETINNYEETPPSTHYEEKKYPLTTRGQSPPPSPRHSEPASYDNYSVNQPGKYPMASLRQLAHSDLTGKSKWELSIMRNEIFARKGYKFNKNPAIKRYFEEQQWYNQIPLTSTNSEYVANKLLSSIEKSNVNLILRYEKMAN